MAADISYPVLKYSHSTGLPGAKAVNLSWTHTTSDHMFVNLVGKDTTRRNGLLEMAIIRGTTTLESVDLAAYIDISARRSSQTRAAFGSTKDSVMQMTYPVDDNQMRRIQLRFQNVGDCQRVVGIIRERGLEFREPRNGRPDTSQSTFRPMTAQPAKMDSPYFSAERLGQPSSIRVPDMEAGSLSNRPTPRPGTVGTSTAVSAFSITPPKIITRDERLAPREVAPTRPSTSQMWRSATVPSQPVALSSDDYHTPLANTRPVEERPASASHAANVEAIYQSAAEDTSMDAALDMRPPDAASNLRPSTAQGSGETSAPSNIPWSSSPSSTQQRPTTALSSSSSRPGSSRALMMAPLPKPKIVQNRAATPAFQSSSSFTKPSSPVRPATALPSASVPDPTKLVRPGTSIASARHVFNSASGETANVRPSTAQPRQKEPLPMTELLARKKPRLNSTAVQRTDSLADAPYEIESPLRMTSGPRHHSFMQASALERSLDTIIGPARIAEDQSLEGYSAKSPEERQALMEQFIIDNLENPSFTTLCEDVEKCWRRIGMGL